MIEILIGIVLLLLGRQLFWLFVGAIGFVTGMMFSEQFLPAQPDWMHLVLPLLVGIIGALLAIFLQKLAVGFAGFLGGGYLLYHLAVFLGSEAFAWLAFLIGGIIGALLLILLFDWALIGLSSLLGATLITQTSGFENTAALFLFLILLAVGITAQAIQLTGRPPAPA